MTYQNGNPYSHLEAIELRLSHERERARMAKTAKEKDWREHNCRMIERERENEIAFLEKRGIDCKPLSFDDISDNDLLFLLGE